ncbi:MAG: peptidylprolyl isomerase [Myxococcaceae bacterium]
MRLQGIRILFAVFAVSAAYTARAELVDRVAAVVNKDVITLSEVEARVQPEMARANVPPSERAKVLSQLTQQALDQLIGEKLLEAEIKELNIEVTDQDLEAAMDDVRKQNGVDPAQFEQLLRQEGYTMAAYKEFMSKHLARLKLINLKVRNKVKISDEDLKAEYAKWAKMEGEDPEVHARHILIKVDPKATPAEVEEAKKKADAIAQEARQPGVDFVELAKKKSEGPSANEGGDLYWFKRGTMVPEFDRVAFNLKPGEVADPVRTKFGFHIIKVDERRNADVKPFEEVKEQLRDRVVRGQLEKYTNDYVQELRSKAAVEVKI